MAKDESEMKLCEVAVLSAGPGDNRKRVFVCIVSTIDEQASGTARLEPVEARQLAEQLLAAAAEAES